MDVSDFYIQLGRQISSARRAKEGLTQERLASVLGLSRPSMVNIEKGRQPLKVHQLVTLADALGLSIVDLLPGSAERSQTVEMRSKLKQFDEPSRNWIERVISAPQTKTKVEE